MNGVVVMAGRRYWTTDGTMAKTSDEIEQEKTRREVGGPDDAELIGSLTEGEWHLPVFDLDYEAQLVPSKTQGHFHLYLNKPITWRQYKRVLRAMAAAGLIQKNYYRQSRRRGQAFVRIPNVRKR